MTKRDKQALADYIRATADALYLRDWDFDVYFGKPTMPEESPDDQEWGLSVEQTRNRKHAAITVPPDFRERYTPDQQKQSIAHELVHCHYMACWEQARLDLLPALGQQSYDFFIAAFERSLEFGVDGLASAFAGFMPDIEWPEPKKKKKKKA